MTLLSLLLEMIIISKASQALRWVSEVHHIINVIPGEPAVVDCRLDNESIHVMLLRARALTKSTNKTVLIPDGKNISQSGQRFTIHHFQSNDNGNYYCKVAPPTSLSQKEYIIFVDNDFRHKVWLRIEPECLKGPLDHMDSVKIKCHTKNSGPVKWFKINRDSGDPIKIEENIKESKDYRNLTLEINATLSLNNVTRVNDSGIYVCWKSNGQHNTRNISVQIIVQDPKPPFVTGTQTEQFHEEHAQSANFTCTISGSPRPEVTWFKGNEQIGQCSGGQKNKCKTRYDNYQLAWVDRRKCEGNTTSWDSTLTVKAPFLWRDLAYTCRARNLFGEWSGNLTGPGKPSSLTTTTAAVANPLPSGYLNVLVIVGVLLFLIVLVIAIVLYRRKKLYGGFYILTLPPTPDYIKELDSCKPLLQQTDRLPYEPEWEFPRDRLKIGPPLGAGNFGQVYLADAIGIIDFKPRGKWPLKRKSRFRLGSSSRPFLNNNHVTKVAVKMLKENATDSEYKDLLSELKILIHVGEHENIVNLLGACAEGRESELLVIIEYCEHGNLLDFLRDRRSIFKPNWAELSTNPTTQFSITDLVTSAIQVTCAMEFLASRRCIHRDLAARNVLVDVNFAMKVADFGLARDICKESQYVKTSSGLLPIKWTAIEALTDRVYTNQSDVWSFGILLWELFTLGGIPYPDMNCKLNPFSELCQFLVDGHRMEKPHDCPDEIYQIMVDCWKRSPQDRPTFYELLERLRRILSQNKNKESRGYLRLAGNTTSNMSLHSIPTADPSTESPTFSR